MAVSCMRNASGDNYRNSSFSVDEAMGEIPHSTECISSLVISWHTKPYTHKINEKPIGSWTTVGPDNVDRTQ